MKNEDKIFVKRSFHITSSTSIDRSSIHKLTNISAASTDHTKNGIFISVTSYCEANLLFSADFWCIIIVIAYSAKLPCFANSPCFQNLTISQRFVTPKLLIWGNQNFCSIFFLKRLAVLFFIQSVQKLAKYILGKFQVSTYVSHDEPS